jgi:hypothetical protein
MPSFISLSCFLQGARGLDGEPGPQGLPGAPVSGFPFTKSGYGFFKAMIDFFAHIYICIYIYIYIYMCIYTYIFMQVACTCN